MKVSQRIACLTMLLTVLLGAALSPVSAAPTYWSIDKIKGSCYFLNPVSGLWEEVLDGTTFTVPVGEPLHFRFGDDATPGQGLADIDSWADPYYLADILDCRIWLDTPYLGTPYGVQTSIPVQWNLGSQYPSSTGGLWADQFITKPDGLPAGSHTILWEIDDKAQYYGAYRSGAGDDYIRLENGATINVSSEDTPVTPVIRQFNQDGVDGLYAKWDQLDTENCHITRYQYRVFDNGVPATPGYTADAKPEVRVSMTLTAGHSYTMGIKGINVDSIAGPEAVTANAVVADTTAPSAPGVSISGSCIGWPLVLNLVPATDAESGIARYRYKVGATAGGNEVLDWQTVENPSLTQIVVSQGNYSASSTYHVSVQAQNGAGIWSISGTMSVSVTATTSGISAAKLLPDGTCVTLRGKVVTVGNDTIQDAFYVQEPAGLVAEAGIKVVSSIPVKQADNVTLTGSMATDPLSQQRMIVAGAVCVNYQRDHLPQIGVRSEQEVANAVGCRVITSGVVHIINDVAYIIDSSWPQGDRVAVTTQGLISSEVPDIVDGQSVYCEGISIGTGSGGSTVVPSYWSQLDPLAGCSLVPNSELPDFGCAGYSKEFRVIDTNTDGSGETIGGIMLFETETSYWGDDCALTTVYETPYSIEPHVIAGLRSGCSSCLCTDASIGITIGQDIDVRGQTSWHDEDISAGYYVADKKVEYLDTTGLHNGKHIIAQASRLGYDCDESDYGAVPWVDFGCIRTVSFDVDNMVIKDTLEDIQTIFYDGSTSPIRIDFTLLDGLENPKTKVTLNIYKLPCQFDSDGNRIPDQTVIRDNLSSKYSGTIDWIPDPALKRGLYAYQVMATHDEVGWIGNYDQSGVLTAHRDNNDVIPTITDADESAVAGIKGVTISSPVENENGQIALDLNYHLTAGKVFKDLQILVKDPDGMDVTAVKDPAKLPAVAGTTNTVKVTFTPEKFGKYYVMVAAKDNDISHDKAHRQKQMIPNGVEWCYAELDTDSNNNLKIDYRDEPVEQSSPGKILVVGKLAKVQIPHQPANGYEVVLSASSGLKMWDTITKNNEVPSDTVYTSGNAPSEIYVEAVSAGTGNVTLVLRRTGEASQLCSNPVTITVFEPVAHLREVSFSSTARDVLEDGTTTTYSAPHWLDADHDGEIETNDQQYPICYTKNTQIETSAVFVIDDPTGWPDTVKVKAEGSYNVNIPEATAARSGNEVTLSATKSTEELEDEVQWIDGLPLHWFISTDDGATWQYAGSSVNEVFVVRGIPTCAGLWRTAAYLACKNGGYGTNDAEWNESCFQNTWKSFSGPANVCKWDDVDDYVTEKLHYYLYDGSSYPDPNKTYQTNAIELLNNGNGQCHAWADLLLECTKVNNVTGVEIIEVDPPDNCDAFAVKNIFFSTSPGYPDLSLAPWNYAVGDLDDIDPPDGAKGIAGQNMETPHAKLFSRHFIVKHNDASTSDVHYYDPSYGVAITALDKAQAEKAYTDAAINSNAANPGEGAWRDDSTHHWAKASSFTPVKLLKFEK